jgi:hypothetical protein
VKRYPFVLGATLAGLAGVFTFHTKVGSSPLTLAPSPAAKTPARPTPTTAGPGAVATTGPPAATATAATGKLVQYGYGELSVQVSASGSDITDVRVVILRTADSYSTQLAQQAAPLLRREVLSAQSAHIQGLTGATYTSEAYAASVQSALDKLHI